MKIQNNSDPAARLRSVLDRLDSTERSSRTRQDSSTAVSGGQDQIQLSSRAREMQSVRDAIANSPDVRQSVVDKLRDEIGSGRYRIDGTRVADGMLQEEVLM